MHIGRGNTKSKTEAMYSPPSLEARHYTNLNLDERIPVKDGYITMTSKFKYLGSWISNNLKDDHEVDTRIAKGKAQIGALRALFNSKYVPMITKYRTYCAIPLNTVLWGCESWSVSERIKQRLSVFHHQSIRSILGINMFHVEAFSITNEQVRSWFCNSPCIIDMMIKRQLGWIGKVARMEPSRMPKMLLNSWIHHPRKPGRPQISYRNTYAQAIATILPIDEEAPASQWVPVAKDKVKWNSMIKTWCDQQKTIM